MSDITCTVQIKIPPKLIADAFSTAFEAGNYGSGAWCVKARGPKGFKLTAAEVAEHCNWYTSPRTWTPGHGHVVTIFELTDEWKGTQVKHEIDVDRIAERLQAFADKAPRLFGEFLASDDEPLDGSAADNVVQMIVLGELRYG